MTTEVTLEHLPGKKYRVTGSGRFAVTTEGETREQAVANFRKIAAHIVTTTEVLNVEIPSARDSNPEEAAFPTTGWADDLPRETWDNFLGTLKRQREEENARVVE